jgi:hypothetical protein
VLKQGRVNRVFEHTGVPYGPGSEACEEAAKKRKQDTCTMPSAKSAKVSGQEVAPVKTSALSKPMSAALWNTAVAKSTHSKSVPKPAAVPGTAVPPKAAVTSVTKVTAAVTCSGVAVLKISTRMKRPAPPPSASGVPREVPAQPPGPAMIGWLIVRCSILYPRSHPLPHLVRPLVQI